MIVPVSRLSPAAKEIYRATAAKKEALLTIAVKAHPEDWSLLCVARAWRDAGASMEAVTRVQRAQAFGADQRSLKFELGRRSRMMEEWWVGETGDPRGFPFAGTMKLDEIKSPEEACLVLNAQYLSFIWLAQMRTFATASIKKFGEHSALIAWRARARTTGYINAYPDGDPRAKNPGGVPSDHAGAKADAKRAFQLTPNDPGIAIVAGDILMLLKDPAGPAIMRRYAAMNDPWTERRLRNKKEYPAFFR